MTVGPSYTDMLRVAFTSEFRRGKLGDLVALLSGRNFATKQYEDAIAEESFATVIGPRASPAGSRGPRSEAARSHQNGLSR